MPQLHPVRVMSPRDRKLEGETVVNTTSRAGWSSDLSPFLLGPVKLYEGALVAESQTMENAWQYAKVYKKHARRDGSEPAPAYWDWAIAGWENPRAVRYPMGKGAIPEFSWWGEEHGPLGYIDARKRIYAPLYRRAVRETEGLKRLVDMYLNGERLALWDFDGYDYQRLGMTLNDVLNNPKRKMGHAFVLARMLQEIGREQG